MYIRGLDTQVPYIHHVLQKYICKVSIYCAENCALSRRSRLSLYRSANIHTIQFVSSSRLLSLSLFLSLTSHVWSCINIEWRVYFTAKEIALFGHSRPGRQLVLNVLDDLGDRHLVTYGYRRIRRRNWHGCVAFHEYLL